MRIANRSFQLEIDDGDGSLIGISHPEDSTRMNWTRNAAQCPIHPSHKNWGKGWMQLPTGRRIPFGFHLTSKADGSKVISSETTEIFEITVTRTLEPDRMLERFELRNRLQKPVTLAIWQIYTPFADELLPAQVGLRNHCVAHVWTGGSDSWVCCRRLSAEPPHLGLVLSSGRLQAYAIEDRDLVLFRSSNSRGTIALLPTGCGFGSPPDWPQKPLRVEAFGTLEIAWSLFWFRDIAEFERGIERWGQGVHLRSSCLVGVGALGPKVFCSRPGALVEINGAHAKTRADGQVDWNPSSSGEYVITVSDKGRDARLVALHLRDPMERIRARTRYIIQHQQVTDPEDPLFGAYLVYDTETDTRVRDIQTADRRLGFTADVNEGRERIGMGVFLARLLAMEPGFPGLRESVLAYDRFFHRCLLDDRGEVYDCADHAKGAKRIYNHSMAQFYLLEMYRTTKETHYLIEAWQVLQRYFACGGDRFYGFIFTLPQMLEALKAEGRSSESERIVEDYRRYAEFLLTQGDFFTASEVDYECTIVAPAAAFLLQAYRWFQDERCLKLGQRYLDLLEMFQGYQPDYRLHGVSLRHWDGFWFGKTMLWGDIMPHYWSALSGMAYWERHRVDGDRGYRAKAFDQIMANFCNIRANGRGSCAYVYPLAVDNEPAHRHDPYANDQDWATYFYLRTFGSETDPAECK